jgi:hypothetical protein
MERVLNVSVGDMHTLYPFSVFESQPVINDKVADLPVVIFSREGTLSVLDAGRIEDARQIPSATAYERRLDGDTLTFRLRDGAIVDDQTGSTWNLLGQAVAGEFKGARLPPAPSGVHFAFAWLAFNPDSTIFGGERGR